MTVVEAIVALAVIALLAGHVERRPRRRLYVHRLEPLDLSRAAARGQLHLNDHRRSGDAADSPTVREAIDPPERSH